MLSYTIEVRKDVVTMRLGWEDACTVAHHLRVAAARYREDAETAATVAGQAGLARQFEDQTREADALADRLENPDGHSSHRGKEG